MSKVQHDHARPRDGGSLIAQVHQLSGRVFARILKRHGIAELNPAQGRIVYALWKEEPLSQSQLAERTRLDKSTLTAMLERLESAGQIRRCPDPDDGRSKLVHLTERNRTLHDTYAVASREMLSIFYADMDDAEIDAFEHTLRKVLGNLEARERTPSG
jgi:DNA-binding MarR family transcriptional regulator